MSLVATPFARTLDWSSAGSRFSLIMRRSFIEGPCCLILLMSSLLKAGWGLGGCGLVEELPNKL